MLNPKNNPQRRPQLMNNSKFARSILKLLGDIVLEHREYHDGLTMLVKDVNAEIDGHWMTIHKESHQVRN